MRRREFLGAIGFAAIPWPRRAHAQQPGPLVIGALGGINAATFNSQLRVFRKTLGEAGFVEGQNVTIESRWADGRYERLPELLSDLIGRKVTVIFAFGGTPVLLAAKAATTTIPIVFVSGADPVASGIVTSLHQPGGNMTGVTSQNQDLGQKRLELLRELMPAATVFGALINPKGSNPAAQTDAMHSAARALQLKLHILHASTAQDFDAAFAELKRLQASALVITNDALFIGHNVALGQLASLHRMPAVSQFRDFAAAGGLMTYGSSFNDTYRIAGTYVARVLKGEHPRDLPVQQASKVELVINLRTARALGISVPLALLGRADEVIE